MTGTELLVGNALTPYSLTGMRAWVGDSGNGIALDAKIVGIDDETGSLELGKLADIIAVDGDPLADIQSLSNVSFVMRAGVVYDPAALKCGEAYLARDFPAGTERYVVDATGYRAVVVNGEVLLENGVHTGALPGHVIRGA